MSRVAVVDIATNIVQGIIVAEASDTPYAGTFLVDVDHMSCDIGWIYDPVINNFIDPNPTSPDDGGE